MKNYAWLLFWSTIIWIAAVSPCMAEPATVTIDPGLKGSLTLIKYEESGSVDQGGTHIPLPDVTYTIYRIAEIAQGTTGTEKKTVSVQYQSLIRDSTRDHQIIEIPRGLTDLKELSLFVNGLRDSADLTKRIGNLNDLECRTGTTGADGTVQFKELPLGIWMVYEETYPSLVTNPQGFVVSIPYTSEETDSLNGNSEGREETEGSRWNYHLTVRPKNTQEAISVEKHIIADEGEPIRAGIQNNFEEDPTNDILTDTEDYNIGDTVRFWVQADVPQNIGELMYFYLEDRLGSGLTFTNDTTAKNEAADVQVWGEPAEGGKPVLIPRKSGSTENYLVTDPSELKDESDGAFPITEDQCRTFRIFFNTRSLSRQPDNTRLDTTKRIPLYRKLWITYSVTLNENALIGNPGNPNDIALKISHTTSGTAQIPNIPNIPGENEKIDVINPQCPDTKVFAYQVVLVKQGEGDASMQGVEFELRDSAGKRVNLNQDQNGYFPAPDIQGTKTMMVGADQSVTLRGLSSGMYQIVETKALPGFTLLRSPVILTIISESMPPYPLYCYQEDPKGEYFQIEAGRGYFIEQNGVKLKIDLNGHSVGSYLAVKGEVKSYDVKLDQGEMNQDVRSVSRRYSFRFTDAESLAWTANFPMQNGTITMTVHNSRSFRLPATGGYGTSLLLILGGLFLAAALCAYLLRNRRRRLKR